MTAIPPTRSWTRIVFSTASKLGLHTQTDRGACPGVGLCIYYKSCGTAGRGSAKIVPSFCVCGPWPSCYLRPRFIYKVLDRCAQAVVRGGARCASQVLDCGAQADARSATHVLDRGVEAVARGAARCALHIHGRGAKTYACSAARCASHVLGRCAKTDACSRGFAVLSTQLSTVGLRLRLSRLG